MSGQTLKWYFAWIFLRSSVSIFLLFFGLIVIVDLIELSRGLSKYDNVEFSSIFQVAIYRAPIFSENVLPFSILFGAAFSLLMLSRRLELVVARASGVSVWQFMFPLVVTSILLGIFASTIFNPLALEGQARSKSVEALIHEATKGKISKTSKNFWIRVAQNDGDTIIRAKVSQNFGTKLSAVSAYRFDSNNHLIDRVDATSASFENQNGQNFYILKDARIHTGDGRLQTKKVIKLPVQISRAELVNNQSKANNASIWQLPALVQRTEQAGKSTLPFVTQIYSLAAQPFLFVAMVLLAGTVSLTFSRFGQNNKAILGGVLAGFVLYVATKLVITFGSNGLVPPFIATWSPAFVASLICMTVLLYQEDG